MERKKFYIKDTVTYSLIAKDETIETPAGKFRCYVYEYVKWPEDDVPDNWHYRHYFSPGIGLVALIVTSENEGRVKEKTLLWKYYFKSVYQRR